eukprot:8278172-Pyramimonas_sp.AAC.1
MADELDAPQARRFVRALELCTGVPPALVSEHGMTLHLEGVLHVEENVREASQRGNHGESF